MAKVFLHLLATGQPIANLLTLEYVAKSCIGSDDEIIVYYWETPKMLGQSDDFVKVTNRYAADLVQVALPKVAPGSLSGTHIDWSKYIKETLQGLLSAEDVYYSQHFWGWIGGTAPLKAAFLFVAQQLGVSNNNHEIVYIDQRNPVVIFSEKEEEFGTNIELAEIVDTLGGSCIDKPVWSKGQPAPALDPLIKESKKNLNTRAEFVEWVEGTSMPQAKSPSLGDKFEFLVIKRALYHLSQRDDIVHLYNNADPKSKKKEALGETDVLAIQNRGRVFSIDAKSSDYSKDSPRKNALSKFEKQAKTLQDIAGVYAYLSYCLICPDKERYPQETKWKHIPYDSGDQFEIQLTSWIESNF